MHWNSLYEMSQFAEKYLDKDKVLNILDIGSKEVLNSGTYKQYFVNDNWNYLGCDLDTGDNVDVIIDNPYILPFGNDSFDIVISGQTFEHIEYFWLTAKEIARVIKPEGLFCLIVPSTGQIHKFPVDCWRFYEDGLKAIAKWMNFEVLESKISDQSEWNDAVLITKKI